MKRIAIFAGLAASSFGLGAAWTPVTTWLETVYPNTVSVSQLPVVSITGQAGLVAGSRTSDFRAWSGMTSQGSEGVIGIGYNDDVTGGTPIAVGGLFDGFRALGSSGITAGAQISVENAGVAVDITPAGGVTNGNTIGLLVTSYNHGGLYTSNESAGIVLGAGGGMGNPILRKGTVNLKGAFDTGLGLGGQGVAQESYIGQSVRWLDASSIMQAEMWGYSGGLAIAGQSSSGQLKVCNVGTAPGCGEWGVNQFANFFVSTTGGVSQFIVAPSGAVQMPEYYTTSGILVNDANGNVTTVSSVGTATTPGNFVANRRIAVNINGTTYYIPVDTAAW